jgi:hypothetical protein
MSVFAQHFGGKLAGRVESQPWCGLAADLARRNGRQLASASTPRVCACPQKSRHSGKRGGGFMVRPDQKA